MMRKSICTFILMIVLSTAVKAQEHQKKFSPEKFETELVEYILKETSLSQQETSKFLPVYKEMRAKQRAVYKKQRAQGKVKPQDEAGFKKAIADRDENEMELKRIQQQYHNRFMELLPASKVYRIISAEDAYHRKAMKNWGGKKQEKPNHK